MNARLRTMARPAAALGLAIALVVSTAGCGIFSPNDTDNDEPGTGGFALATTQDQAIENFRRAWEERNYQEYENLLHDDFLFYFAQTDVEELELPGETWERVRELDAAAGLFGTGGSSSGPSVESITIQLSPQDEWSDEVDAAFAGTEKKTYFVNMRVTYSNDDIDDVKGNQFFYVVPVEIEVEGASTTVYQLKFWQDQGYSVSP